MRILPLHDIIWNFIQILLFGQMAYFFWSGPMLKIPWFCFGGIAANITLIIASIIFYLNRTKELYSGRGTGYWFYYYARLLCTLTCILLCATFILSWGIRYWIVYKFDPNLTLNIVNDSNAIIGNDTLWLFIMVVIETLVYCLAIFHHAQTLYMMRLVNIFFSKKKLKNFIVHRKLRWFVGQGSGESFESLSELWVSGERKFFGARGGCHLFRHWLPGRSFFEVWEKLPKNSCFLLVCIYVVNIIYKVLF